jgi:hypothetical protein|tara:strand:- start:1085 stop:1351 length:267 start_codon:yes stop_codon:yes gene_type:complete
VISSGRLNQIVLDKVLHLLVAEIQNGILASDGDLVLMEKPEVEILRYPSIFARPARHDLDCTITSRGNLFQTSGVKVTFKDEEEEKVA